MVFIPESREGEGGVWCGVQAEEGLPEVAATASS